MQRKTTMDYFVALHNRRKTNICIILCTRLPGIDCFVIDWLHACDLGVAQDFLGNLIFSSLVDFQQRQEVEFCF